MSVPGRGEATQGLRAVRHADIGDSFLYGCRKVLADYGGNMSARHYRNIAVSVGGDTADCHKHSSLADFSGVALEAFDIFVGLSDYFEGLDLFKKAGKFDCHISDIL